MRTFAFASLALALAGCFVSPGDRGTSSTGTSATTAANGTGSTTGAGSTSSSTGGSSSGGSTGGCVVDSDCHRSNPDECNICTDMRLVCDQGACVCACQVGTSSSSGTSGSSGSSGGCWKDADCPPVAGVSQYCDIAVSACTGNVGSITPSPGLCHRDCVDGSCTCTRDDDCPIFGCDTSQGRCNIGGVFCPNAPPCPDGCTDSSLAVVVCPFCLCSVCPSPDAGGDLCGGCGPGTTCCGAYGGVELFDGGGGGPSYGCHALEVDGGCPPGAICAESSSGEIESCNFYYP